MKWLEITIDTTSEASDALYEKLESIGARGAAVEDPSEIAAIVNAPGSLSYADEGYLDSLGDRVHIRAYFVFPESEILVREITDKVREAVADVGEFLDIGNADVSVRVIEEEDWANSWKKHFKPLRISLRTMICPSWDTCDTQDGVELIVKLDPGSAFGTGDHATTAMCAELLDNELASRETNRTVLDLGCGSGILSVIAAGLGAQKVDALDIDPVAVSVAKENCRVNNVLEIVNIETGVIYDLVDRRYDIIAANIIADVIADIASEIPDKLNDGGVFITSGIIAEKKDFVLETCVSAGLKPVEIIERSGWVAMSFKNNVY